MIDPTPNINKEFAKYYLPDGRIDLAKIKREQYIHNAMTSMNIFELTKDEDYAFYAREFFNAALETIKK